MDKVWHYTPWSYLKEICGYGELLTTNTGAAHENPLLWFSANQRYEPTAIKLTSNGLGGLRRTTFDEQVSKVGCIRFGLSAKDLRLLNWDKACKTAGMTKKEKIALEARGKELGANPAQWFASETSIGLAELQLQVWVNEWLDMDVDSASTMWANKSMQGLAGEGVPKST